MPVMNVSEVLPVLAGLELLRKKKKFPSRHNYLVKLNAQPLYSGSVDSPVSHTRPAKLLIGHLASVADVIGLVSAHLLLTQNVCLHKKELRHETVRVDSALRK